MESTTIQVAKIGAGQKIYSQSMSRVTGIFENGVFEIYVSGLNIANEISEFPSLLTASSYGFFLYMRFTLQHFKNDNCFPSFFFFQLMSLSRKDFQRNVQHSIRMPDITKGNSNIHFILGNRGHA